MAFFWHCLHNNEDEADCFKVVASEFEAGVTILKLTV